MEGLVGRMRIRLKSFWVNLSVYVAMTLAGGLSFFVPPTALKLSIATVIIFAWSTLVTVGGASCVFGILTGRLIFKLFGIPLLISATLGYGTVILAIVLAGRPQSVVGALITIFLFYALSGLLALRWMEIRRILSAESRRQ